LIENLTWLGIDKDRRRICQAFSATLTAGGVFYAGITWRILILLRQMEVRLWASEEGIILWIGAVGRLGYDVEWIHMEVKDLLVCWRGGWTETHARQAWITWVIHMKRWCWRLMD